MTTSVKSPSEKAALLLALQEAVAAKAAYWDKVRELEILLSDGSTLSDQDNDTLTLTLDNLAAGIDAPSDAFNLVQADELDHLLGELSS